MNKPTGTVYIIKKIIIFCIYHHNSNLIQLPLNDIWIRWRKFFSDWRCNILNFRDLQTFRKKSNECTSYATWSSIIFSVWNINELGPLKQSEMCSFLKMGVFDFRCVRNCVFAYRELHLCLDITIQVCICNSGSA